MKHSKQTDYALGFYLGLNSMLGLTIAACLWLSWSPFQMGDGLVVLLVILALAIAAWALTYQVGIEDGPSAYKTFRDKADGCVKVVIRTND